MNVNNQIENEITESMMRLYEGFGLSPTLVRIYMTVFFSTEPIGLNEIAAKTGYSISTICKSMDLIERFMDIRSFKKPGSKKIFWECQHDLILVHRKKMQIGRIGAQSMDNLLANFEEKLPADSDSPTHQTRAFIVKMRNDYKKMSLLIDGFERTLDEISRKKDGK
jgi:DNA-binding transcriptional regulator GbsR (MarR family)